jgi:hypothetical protein
MKKIIKTEMIYTVELMCLSMPGSVVGENATDKIDNTPHIVN